MKFGIEGGIVTDRPNGRRQLRTGNRVPHLPFGRVVALEALEVYVLFPGVRAYALLCVPPAYTFGLRVLRR